MVNFFQNNIVEKILKILKACIKTHNIILRLNILFISKPNFILALMEANSSIIFLLKLLF